MGSRTQKTKVPEKKKQEDDKKDQKIPQSYSFANKSP